MKFVHVMDMDHDPVKAKQQKKVRSPYFKSSVHTGGYEPQWSEGAVFGSAHGPHPKAKSDDVQHSERGPIYVYSDDVQRSEQGSIYHFDMPAAGGDLVARYTGESGSVATPEDVDARRRQTGHSPQLAATKPDWGDKREGERAWNRTDLTVLCTEGRCQVNMGDIPVLFTAPTWGGIEHVAAAPSGLGRTETESIPE